MQPEPQHRTRQELVESEAQRGGLAFQFAQRRLPLDRDVDGAKLARRIESSTKSLVLRKGSREIGVPGCALPVDGPVERLRSRSAHELERVTGVEASEQPREPLDTPG